MENTSVGNRQGCGIVRWCTCMYLCAMPTFAARPEWWTSRRVLPPATVLKRGSGASRDEHILWICAGGAGQLQVDGERHQLGVGDCWYLDRGLRRVVTVTSRQPLTLLAVQYQAQERLRSPHPAPHTHSDDVALITRLYERLRAVLERDHGQASSEADCWYDALLAATSVRVGKRVTSDDQQIHAGVIQDLCERIRCNPGIGWRISEMAAHCNFSRSHFSRLFSGVIGCSPRTFLTRVRCDAAKHLLSDTDLSQARIAEELGFSDAFHFSRQFKNATGQSPSAWRARDTTQRD